MGDEHGAGAAGLEDLAHLGRQALAQVDVEVGEGLVHQHQRRPRRERAAERDALLLAARQLVRIALRVRRQADQGEHLGHPRAPVGRAPAVEAEGDVVGDRQVREQRVVLEHHADAARLGRAHRAAAADDLAGDGDLPAGQRHEAGDGAQHRRLAAARGAEQAGDGVGRQLERQPAHGRRVAAVGDGDVAHAEEGRGWAGDAGAAAGARGVVCGIGSANENPYNSRRCPCASPSRRARRAGIRGAAQPLVLAALAVALLMTLPVLGVVGHLGAGQASTRAVWAHLLDTVLAEAAATSLALGALVVCGVDVRRHRRGLAGDAVRLPRPALADLGADAAAGDAGLRRRLRLHRPAAVQRPGADGAARGLRAAAARLLVSRDPLAAGRRGAVRRRALSVRLRADAAGLPRARPAPGRRRAHARLHAAGGVLARRAAAGAPGDDRRRHAGADGDAVGLRRGRVLRPADLHAEPLQRLVQPRRPRRRGAARVALLAVVAVVVARRAQPARRARATPPPRCAARPARHRLRGAAAARVFLLCLLPVVAGFALPALLLLRLHLRLDGSPRWDAYGRWLLHSVAVGGATARARGRCWRCWSATPGGSRRGRWCASPTGWSAWATRCRGR